MGYCWDWKELFKTHIVKIVNVNMRNTHIVSPKFKLKYYESWMIYNVKF